MQSSKAPKKLRMQAAFLAGTLSQSRACGAGFSMQMVSEKKRRRRTRAASIQGAAAFSTLNSIQSPVQPGLIKAMIVRR